jgi:hypothetical protein
MGVGDGSKVEAKAREDAARRGWAFDRVAGDLVLIRRLVEGEWENDFLVLKSGEQVKMTYDEQVIGCTPS